MSTAGKNIGGLCKLSSAQAFGEREIINTSSSFHVLFCFCTTTKVGTDFVQIKVVLKSQWLRNHEIPYARFRSQPGRENHGRIKSYSNKIPLKLRKKGKKTMYKRNSAPQGVSIRWASLRTASASRINGRRLVRHINIIFDLENTTWPKVWRLIQVCDRICPGYPHSRVTSPNRLSHWAT